MPHLIARTSPLNRLWIQLSLAFGGVVLVGVLIILGISSILNQPNTFQPLPLGSLSAPGGMTDRLAEFYTAHNGWNGVQDFLGGAESALPPGANLALRLAAVDGTVYQAPLPITGNPGIQAPNPPIDALPPVASARILVNGVLVGTLTGFQVTPPAIAQLMALNQLRDSLLVVALVNALLGILFGILFSRSLTAPLDQLVSAAESIAARDLSRRVTPRGSREIVAVANAFNAMAAALDQAETLRRNMVADVAHELRTPLTVLQGNLQAILDGVYPLEVAEIARLYDQTHLLTRLVDDLHALTLADAHQLRLNPAPTDVRQLLEKIVASFAASAEAGGSTIRLDVPPGLPRVSLDAIRMTQVFSNLISNALRHMPNGGQIAIQTEVIEKRLRIRISDQGEGIAPEHLPYVFDRFYRVDKGRARALGGAGLGLAIVRALVETHQGTVTAASDGINGHGTIFTIELPLRDKMN